MDLGISGRVALVTGASKGIGNAIARELIAEGARVAMSSRSPERIAAAAEEIGALGIPHDSADLEGVASLVDRVESELGPVEILVLNTGGPPGGPALGFSREQWEAAYRTLVEFPIVLLDRVLPGMRERGFGRVVNVASSSVREPIDGLMLSNAHRSATLAAFKTLSREFASDGVTLNTVLPGRIATDRLAELMGSLQQAEEVARAEVPIGRLGTPQEFAAAVAFLCSARASYITGTALLVDGGVTRSV
jgi:3-oxoacyl-[acyl-carrier protein] reductase